MKIKLGNKEFTPEEVAFLADNGLLNVGQKNDPFSTTPNTQGLYGPFPGNNAVNGVFSGAGVRPGMFDATARVRTFTSALRFVPTTIWNEYLEILTGATAAQGTNSTSACATAPTPGLLKVMRIAHQFGIINMDTKVFDVTQAGARLNRGSMDREAYNTARFNNPFIPDIEGIDGSDRLSSELRAEFYNLGLAIERAASRVSIAGTSGTENNDYLGVARQWGSLDSQIIDTYSDSVTGFTADVVDSVIESFNAASTGTDANGRNLNTAMNDLYFSVKDRADQVSQVSPSWVWVMRPDAWRVISRLWASQYAIYQVAGASDSLVFNADLSELQRQRQEFTSGMYLVMEDGARIQVVLDDAIARDTLGNNHYKSDIYLVATQWGAQPLAHFEFFDMDNDNAREIANMMGAQTSMVVNNGLYRIFRLEQGGCVQFKAFARPRMVLDAPFLSGRLDDVQYNYYAKTRDPIPGQSLYANGGVTQR